MLVVSGNEQTGTVAKQLALPLRIRVVDSAGLPVSGQLVNFRIVAGNGSVFAGASITTDSGNASELWTLGTSIADSQKVEARAVDPETAQPLVFATFRATAIADVAATIAKVAGDGQTPIAGSAAPTAPSVLVTDKYGNPVSGVTVTFAVASGGGSITGAASTTNSSGIAQVGGWTMGATAGTNTLTATAAGLAGSPLTFIATSQVGPAAVMVPRTASTTGPVGNFVATPPSVLVTDAVSNPVPGTTVTFAVVAGGGGVRGTLANGNLTQGGSSTAAVSNAQGIASLFYWQLGPAPGTNTVSATFTGYSGSPATFTATGVMLQQVQSITTGTDHSCALTNAGVAYCWGFNAQGQLGDGSQTGRASPVAVAGNLVFSRISAVAQHTCGLASSGAAYCWGTNTDGQLGDGSTTDRTTPVRVSDNQVFATISAGGQHTCGITSAGVTYCWGNNSAGQLGEGSAVVGRRTSPVQVTGGLTFASIDAGGTHTCALAGSIGYCWGASGLIGDGTDNGFRTQPTLVSGGLSMAVLSAGPTFSCAVTTSSAGNCWGTNTERQLGDGTSDPAKRAPSPIAGGLSFSRVAASSRHGCGITTAGAAYCWGSPFNNFGQIGNGLTQAQPTPVAVAGGLSFQQIAAGFYHSCGLTTGGDVYCWGYNAQGQIGDGTNTDRTVPQAVRAH